VQGVPGVLGCATQVGWAALTSHNVPSTQSPGSWAQSPPAGIGVPPRWQVPAQQLNAGSQLVSATHHAPYSHSELMKQLPPTGTIPTNTFEHGTCVSAKNRANQVLVQSIGLLYPATQAAAASASYLVFPEATSRNVVGTIQGRS